MNDCRLIILDICYIWINNELVLYYNYYSIKLILRIIKEFVCKIKLKKNFLWELIYIYICNWINWNFCVCIINEIKY